MGIERSAAGGAFNMVVESFKIVESAYGKAGVKILHVSKHGSVHTIRELEVETSLTLNNHKELDFDTAYTTVQDTVLEVFAGPAYKGIFSPSVQNSQFLTQKMILEKIPEVDKISISMPSVHYFGFDFSKFPRLPGLSEKCSGDVYNPVDKPSGQITSTLARAMLTSKL